MEGVWGWFLCSVGVAIGGWYGGAVSGRFNSLTLLEESWLLQCLLIIYLVIVMGNLH